MDTRAAGEEVDYDHSLNLHTIAGARKALSMLFPDGVPRLILDVGCGTGTWLRSALDLGATEVMGVDGVTVPNGRLHIDRSLVRQVNLEQPLDLKKRFDLVISLEVAEHLAKQFAPRFVESLVRHGDKILFAAAAPNQDGMHHVNCQWPAYWQALFNNHGFACVDAPRWTIWNESEIEPWYRQNLILARRDDAAGSEPRINPVIHPDALECFAHIHTERIREQIEEGSQPFNWYARTTMRVILSRLKAKVRSQ
ncbi:methyltransferase domain-containing protein [Sphingomonas sp. HDW15A]|uniref:methyltransferase domain-containing protein n=1 Tax=Sphingomonas sp. HDW15A TaxID=2714942 RepID=UPI0014092180|nr:methyltransferase domain-containing protein [Sphingomonas sp. HDW15A]QIK95838.1 methyltransferase domain-containing protein [Sphingomonas sp. HDW15A]